MKLYFDFGNTFIKWAVDNDKADLAYDALDVHRCHHNETSKIIDFICVNSVTHVTIASPRQSQSLTELIQFLTQNLIAHHLVEVDPTLFSISYDDPKSFGVDRYLNLIAANALANTPFCVISAGTATTVDFFDGNKHCGGAIFLGLHSQIDKMQESTGLILNENNINHKQLLGNNTQQSLAIGLVMGHQLMLNSYIENVSNHLKIKFNPLYTGGNAKLISENSNNIDYNLNFLGMKIYNKMMGI